MKYSLILSFTLLGLTSAACTPTPQAGPDSPARTVIQSPAAPPAPPAASTGRGGRKGKGGRRRKPPPPNKPSSPIATTPSPPANSNSSKDIGGGGGGGGGVVVGGTVQDNLVPQFGIQAGVNPQNGNCIGLNDIKIPCVCPPDRNAFVAKMQEFVNAGSALGTPISFPTDSSLKSQITRLTASIVTLQNFNGKPGSGCPASSTTFVKQRAALLANL